MASFVPKCSTAPVPTSKSTEEGTNMLTEQEVHTLVERLTMHGHKATGDAELLVETLMASEEPVTPVHASFKHVSNGPLHASSGLAPSSVASSKHGEAAWLDRLFSAASQEAQPKAKQLIKQIQ